MAQGGLNVLITNPRDMPNFVEGISSRRSSTMFTGVNTLFAALLNTPGFEFSSTSAAQGLRSAAAWPCSRRSPKEWKRDRQTDPCRATA